MSQHATTNFSLQKPRISTEFLTFSAVEFLGMLCSTGLLFTVSIGIVHTDSKCYVEGGSYFNELIMLTTASTSVVLNNNTNHYFEEQRYGVQHLPPDVNVRYHELHRVHDEGGGRGQLIHFVNHQILGNRQSDGNCDCGDCGTLSGGLSYRVVHIVRWPNGVYVVRALLGIFKTQVEPTISLPKYSGATSNDDNKLRAKSKLKFPASTRNNNRSLPNSVGDSKASMKLLITLKLHSCGEFMERSERFQIYTTEVVDDDNSLLLSTNQPILYVQPNKLPSMVFFINSKDIHSKRDVSSSKRSVRFSGVFTFDEAADSLSQKRYAFTQSQFNSFRNTYMKSLKMVDCRRVVIEDVKIQKWVVDAMQEKILAHDYNGRSFLLSTATLGTFLYAIEYMFAFADGSCVVTLSMGKYDDGLPEIDADGNLISSANDQLKDLNLHIIHQANPQDCIDAYLKSMFREAAEACTESRPKIYSQWDIIVEPAPNHYAQYMSPEDANYCNWEHSSTALPLQSSYTIDWASVIICTINTGDRSQLEPLNDMLSPIFPLISNASLHLTTPVDYQAVSDGTYRLVFNSLDDMKVLWELVDTAMSNEIAYDWKSLEVTIYDVDIVNECPIASCTPGTIYLYRNNPVNHEGHDVCLNDVEHVIASHFTEPLVCTAWNRSRSDGTVQTIGITVHKLFSTSCIQYLALCFVDMSSVEWNCSVTHITTITSCDIEGEDNGKVLLCLGIALYKPLAKRSANDRQRWKYSHLSVFFVELDLSNRQFQQDSINLWDCHHWDIHSEYEYEREFVAMLLQSNILLVSIAPTEVCNHSPEFYMAEFDWAVIRQESKVESLALPVMNPLQLASSNVDHQINGFISSIIPTKDETEMFTIMEHRDTQVASTSAIWYWKATSTADTSTWFTVQFTEEHSDRITCVDYGQLCFNKSHAQSGKDVFERWDGLFSGTSPVALDQVNILVTGSADKSVIVWDVSNPIMPALTSRLTNHQAPICELKVVARDATIVSMSSDNVIMFFNIFSGFCFRTVSHPTKLLSMDIVLVSVFDDCQYSDIGTLVVGRSEKEIVVWNGLSNHRHNERYSYPVRAMCQYDQTSAFIANSDNELSLVDWHGRTLNSCSLASTSSQNLSTNIHVNCVAITNKAIDGKLLLVIALSTGELLMYFFSRNDESPFTYYATMPTRLANIKALAVYQSNESPQSISIFAGGIHTLGCGLQCWARSDRSKGMFEQMIDIFRLKHYCVASLFVFNNPQYDPLLLVGDDVGNVSVWNIQGLNWVYVLQSCGSGMCRSISAIIVTREVELHRVESFEGSLGAQMKELETIVNDGTMDLLVACAGANDSVYSWKLPLTSKNRMVPPSPTNRKGECKLISAFRSLKHKDNQVYGGDTITAVTLLSTTDSACALSKVLLISATNDNVIFVWSLTSKRVVHIIGSHTARINDLLVMRPVNSQLPVLFSGSNDGCTIWNDGLTASAQPPSKHTIIRFFYSDLVAQNHWSQCKQLLECYPNLFYEMPQLFYLALIEREESFFVDFAPQLMNVIALIPPYSRSIHANDDQDACRWIHHLPDPERKVDILEYAMHTRALIALRAILLAWCEMLNRDIKDAVNQRTLYAIRTFNEKVLLELAIFFPVEYTEFIRSIRLIQVHRSVESINYNLFRVLPNAKRTVVFGSNFFRANPELDDSFRPAIDASQLENIRHLRHFTSALRLRVYDALMTFKLMVVKGEDFDKQAVMPFMLPIKRFVDLRQFFVAIRSSDELKSVDIFETDIMRAAIDHYWNVYGFRLFRLNLLQYVATVTSFVVSIYLFGKAVSNDEPNVTALNHAQSSIAAFLCFEAWFGLDEVCQVVGKHWKLYKHNRTYVRLFHILVNHFFLDFWNVVDCSIVFTGVLGSLRRHFELDECYHNSAYIDVPLIDSTGTTVGMTKRCNPWTDNAAVSSCLLATTAALLWFKVLYFLRPIKSSGQFVIMVTVIISDIKFFLLVLICVLVGFAQGFWLLLSQTNVESDFASIKQSFFATFMFMFGQLELEELSQSQSEAFTKLFLVAFMLAMMLLLFNLLIALMGDSFSKTNEKIEAYYLKELASFMVDQSMLTPGIALLRLVGWIKYEKDDFIHVIKYASDVSTNRSRLTYTNGVNDGGDDNGDDDDKRENIEDATILPGIPKSSSTRILRKSFEMCAKIVKSAVSSHHLHFRTLHKSSVHNDIIGRLTVVKSRSGSMISSVAEHTSSLWEWFSFFYQDKTTQTPSQTLLINSKSQSTTEFYGDGIRSTDEESSS